MSFSSLLNRRCTVETAVKTQNPINGEIILQWAPMYQNIKCRIRTRTAEERKNSSSEYMVSTHAMYLEYLKLDAALTRIICDGQTYRVTGQLNMGGGHEYLCLYLEVKE